MSYRGYQKVPKPYRTEEWKSFLSFARNHYLESVELATNIVLEKCGNLSTATPLGQILLKTLLDKIASPLVYVWEEWQLLTSEQRRPYATEEYRKQLEACIQKAKETLQKAESMGFAKSQSQR